MWFYYSVGAKDDDDDPRYKCFFRLVNLRKATNFIANMQILLTITTACLWCLMDVCKYNGIPSMAPIAFVWTVVNIIISGMLFVGLSKEKQNFFIPFLILQKINIFALTVIAICTIISMGQDIYCISASTVYYQNNQNKKRRNSIYIAVFTFIFVVFEICSLFIIFKLFCYYKAKNALKNVLDSAKTKNVTDSPPLYSSLELSNKPIVYSIHCTAHPMTCYNDTILDHAADPPPPYVFSAAIDSLSYNVPV